MAKRTPSPEALIARLAASPKYRDLAASTIRDVVTREHGRHDASRFEGLARRRLHTVLARYLLTRRLEPLVAAVEASFDAGDDAVRAACAAVLAGHKTTAMRLPVVSELYERLFAVTGPPAIVADLACGVNPFAFRWMGLDRTTTYLALDNDAANVDAVGRYFAREEVAGEARWQDVLCDDLPASDVALLLQMFHCLELRRPGAALELVARVPARWLAVSHPTVNFRGRPYRQAADHERRVAELAAREGWAVTTFDAGPERVQVVRKQA